MKNIKRWLVALMCVLMCVLVFAACTDNKPSGSASATPAPTGTSGAETGNTPNTPDKIAMKAGDVYKIFVWANAVENQWVDGITGGARAEEIRQRWLDFQEQYGVTVTWIASPGGDWMGQVLTAAASGENSSI